MEAKELRLGNYVGMRFGIQSEYSFKRINCENICSIFNNVRYLDFKPLPLTEAWLLKFGFKRHGGDYYNDIIILKNVVCFDTGRVFDAFEIKIFPNELGSAQGVEGMLEIKYLHQLQNLHFALTGEELIIN